jgi:hypothetical protein
MDMELTSARCCAEKAKQEDSSGSAERVSGRPGPPPAAPATGSSARPRACGPQEKSASTLASAGSGRYPAAPLARDGKEADADPSAAGRLERSPTASMPTERRPRRPTSKRPHLPGPPCPAWTPAPPPPAGRDPADRPGPAANRSQTKTCRLGLIFLRPSGRIGMHTGAHNPAGRQVASAARGCGAARITSVRLRHSVRT